MQRLVRNSAITLFTSLLVVGGALYYFNDKNNTEADLNIDEIVVEDEADIDATRVKGTTQNVYFSTIKENYIYENPEIYPENLVALIEKNPEILDFVYNYPTAHLANYDIDISSDVESAMGDVPYFSQFDARWGYMEYGTGVVGYTGCGPVALSMVAVYLTGNLEFSPDYVVRYAIDNDYCIPGNGTAWSLMYEGCEAFGISSYELTNSEYAMKNALDNDEPIICLMGPGDFTSEGHFIVLTGYPDEGFYVNDPYSVTRSNTVWSYDQIENQINAMWAFY